MFDVGGFVWWMWDELMFWVGMIVLCGCCWLCGGLCCCLCGLVGVWLDVVVEGLSCVFVGGVCEDGVVGLLCLVV